MATDRFSPKIPPGGFDNPRRYADAINRVVEGRLEAYTSVTLTPGATTTTISQQNISRNSVILLSPRTANAAAALATTFVSAVADGSATLTHSNNAQVDRTFGVVWIG
jgi:hypothetical protein